LEAEVVEAFKFLRPGRVGPFTGVTWPQPGDWLESDRPIRLCRSGVHALLPEAFPVWIAEELWRVELQGVEAAAPGIVVGERGRLLDRVRDWNDDTAREFARACAAHVREGASGRAAEYAADATASAEEAVADFTTTTVAYMAAHSAEAASPGGFAAERAWQARWLATRLGLVGEI
jgi:hypothetical protein